MAIPTLRKGLMPTVIRPQGTTWAKLWLAGGYAFALWFYEVLRSAHALIHPARPLKTCRFSDKSSGLSPGAPSLPTPTLQHHRGHRHAAVV